MGAAALAQAPETPEGAPRPSPSAADGDQRLRRIQERKASLERDLTRLRGRERSLLGEVERLELEVKLREEELRETQTILHRANTALDATVKQVREKEATLDEARPVLSARARALYKQGQLSYLRLLLSVDRPADVFRGYRFVTTLARRDNQRIARFRADLAELTRTRAALERQTQEALALRASLDRARRSLDGDRRRKTELLTEIVERKETHAAYVQELETAAQQLRQLVSGLSGGEVSVPILAFKGSLPWPAGGRVRVAFGRRKHARFDTYTLQNGIEIETAAEAPVLAVHEGTVVFADLFSGYGLMVVVDHGGKHHSLYAHLGEIRVATGQRVAAGQEVGTAGRSLEGTG
ncbi:MAG TPA: peptidoglycan DD-metalloendopeptidase family protein, partial [Vicinamibacteria bacterium]|nr:peptidoglycan DD-metalloendopeptidase family protein [Vicinamibacteria bacterium]